MRKTALLAILLTLTLLLFVSCRSTSAKEEFTDAEYRRVLDSVLEDALSQTELNLFMNLNDYKEAMVHKDYSFFLEYRNLIPGLNHILEEWSVTVSEDIIAKFDDFRSFIAGKIGDLDFSYARTMLSGAKNSITQFIKPQIRNDLVRTIRAAMADIDTSIWESAIVQYKAWKDTQKMLDRDRYEDLPQERNAIDLLAEHLTDLFFDTLETEETLVRTTPDPDMDEKMARILGIE